MATTSRAELEERFPGLWQSAWEFTSPATDVYNCLTWAAGDATNWWWPDKSGRFHWPASAPREVDIEAFLQAYATLGFAPCEDSTLEQGVEKIAVYLQEGRPTHAARQLPYGRWTSKCGRAEDIVHELRALEGDVYGQAVRFMSRQCPT